MIEVILKIIRLKNNELHVFPNSIYDCNCVTHHSSKGGTNWFKAPTLIWPQNGTNTIKQHIWTLKRYSSSRFSHTRTLTDQSFASFVTFLESYKLQNYVTGHVEGNPIKTIFQVDYRRSS